MTPARWLFLMAGTAAAMILALTLFALCGYTPAR